MLYDTSVLVLANSKGDIKKTLGRCPVFDQVFGLWKCYEWGSHLGGLVSGISLLRGSRSLRKALYPYLRNNSSASFCSCSDSSSPHLPNRGELGNSFLTTFLSFFTSTSATASFFPILFIRLTVDERAEFVHVTLQVNGPPRSLNTIKPYLIN